MLSFRDNTFANPEGLIAFIAQAGRGGAGAARHEGRVLRRLGEAEQRLHGTTAVLRNLVRIAEPAKAA